VDAGAHIGTFSVPASLSGAGVIMIEGAQKNVECLRATFGKTQEIHQAILADSVRKCSFSRDTGPFGWMVEDPDGDFVTNTIDAIVGNKKVSAIKLDNTHGG
jgi:FkbM family methyltransferase